MSVSALMYGKFFNTLAAKDVDIDADTIKMMLTTSTYTPNQDTHEFKSDVTNEVSGTGYSAGGTALGSVTYTYTSGTNTWKFASSDVTWTTTSITARYAVMYDNSSGGADSSRRLIEYIDFGGDQTTSSADFIIQMNASGWWTITVS